MGPLRHQSGRRFILRHEIPDGAGYAVIVSPAIDDRELLAPVAMSRRGLRSLPFQRRRSPGIAAGLFSFEQAPNQFKQENMLCETDIKRLKANDRVVVMRGC